ncbi:unnamed protein product [Cladocopium goreaui]|uniref:PDZ domain-containing protein n=1 Tax=Cladocopium goreaui TaxID=2562237 RepID=A0A9P1FH16_9DINO|nr:unnamed protein product [Cladocopium goreaui]
MGPEKQELKAQEVPEASPRRSEEGAVEPAVMSGEDAQEEPAAGSPVKESVAGVAVVADPAEPSLQSEAAGPAAEAAEAAEAKGDAEKPATDEKGAEALSPVQNGAKRSPTRSPSGSPASGPKGQAETPSLQFATPAPPAAQHDSPVSPLRNSPVSQQLEASPKAAELASFAPPITEKQQLRWQTLYLKEAVCPFPTSLLKVQKVKMESLADWNTVKVVFRATVGLEQNMKMMKAGDVAEITKREDEPKQLDLDDTEALRQHAAGYGGGELNDDLNLANDLSNSDFVSPSDSKEFTVKLQKLPGMRLGVECVQFADELVVQAISEGMVAEEWNQKNPFLAIKEGDVIRQVNSIRGDPMKMLSKLRSGLVLTVKAEHCSRQVPREEENHFQTIKRTGGALLRFHQRMEMEAQIMDQAFAMAAISRRHERQDLDAKVWEAASAWNLESFMFFEEVPFLAAFGYTAKDKLNWDQGKVIPKLTMDLDEHFEQAGCTWYVIKCKLEVPVDDGKVETMTWEAPRRLHHLRMELHDRMKYYMEEKFYARVFGETPFARQVSDLAKLQHCNN